MLTRDRQDLHQLQRIVDDVRRRRRAAELRCFWSFPFGHRRNSLHICMDCGHDAGARLADPVPVVARSRRYL